MKKSLTLIASTLMVGSAFSANAATPYKSDFEITLGAFYSSSIDTQIKLNGHGPLSKGHTFDLEDVFGLDEDKMLGFGEVLYRFNERHSVEGSYFNLDREGDRSAQRDITIGNTTFLINTSLETELDFEVYKLSYIYTFMSTSDYALGAALGLHITDIGFNIKGTLNNLTTESDASELTAPLPVVGLRGDWRISDNWIIDSSVDYFYLSLDDYEGGLIDLGVAIEYDKFEYVSVGVGWEYYKIDLDVDKERFDGELDFEYYGPMVYLKGRF